MTVRYTDNFLRQLKKANVRTRKSVRVRILQFTKNPNDPQLNNHPLKDEYEGYRSIDITADWRAVYREAQIGEDIVAYFVALGTHEELYGKQSEDESV